MGDRSYTSLGNEAILQVCPTLSEGEGEFTDVSYQTFPVVKNIVDKFIRKPIIKGT